MKQETQHPTDDECSQFSITAYRGIEVGLGKADPMAEIARKLEGQHSGHLILVQVGKFLHGYDRTAYALNTLKKYQIKLVGTAADPHLRVGFPAGNFKRRLWSMVDELGIPYAVALGSRETGHTVYVSEHANGNVSILNTITDQIVHQVIGDLQQRGEVNKAVVKQQFANPDSSGFNLKSRAQELDDHLLKDIIKMPRDLRATYGENLRACMARVMRNVYAYGTAEQKAAVLHDISADVDLLKHYFTQAPRLSRKNLEFEHRAGLAVELGRLVGGLIRRSDKSSVKARS